MKEVMQDMTYHISHWRWILLFHERQFNFFQGVDVYSTNSIGLMQAKQISTNVISKDQASKVVSEKYKRANPKTPGFRRNRLRTLKRRPTVTRMVSLDWRGAQNNFS